MSLLEHLIKHGAVHLSHLLNEKANESSYESEQKILREIWVWHGFPADMVPHSIRDEQSLEELLTRPCDHLIDTQQEHLWHPCHGEVERLFKKTCPCHSTISPDRLKQQRRTLRLVNELSEDIRVAMLITYIEGGGESDWTTVKSGSSKDIRLDLEKCPPRELYLHARTQDGRRTWGSEKRFRARKDLSGHLDAATGPIPQGFFANFFLGIYDTGDKQMYVLGDKIREVAKGTVDVVTYNAIPRVPGTKTVQKPGSGKTIP